MSKRRLAVLVSVCAAIVSLGAGTALAATFVGTSGPDLIVGSRWDDLISGRGGNDRLYGMDGRDQIRGGFGRDFVHAGDDDAVDRVDCGPGVDTVVVDLGSSRPSRDFYLNCELRSFPIQPHR